MADTHKTMPSLDPRKSDRAPDLSYLESTLGYRMKRALVALYRGIYDSLGGDGLTLVQFSVLSIVQDNPGIAQSELAKALGVERPRLVPVIDTLEKRGLAERRQNPEDRRGRMIYLTADGTFCIRQLKMKFDAHQKTLRDQIGGVTFDQLLGTLERISDSAPDKGQEKDRPDES
ncbi:MarR family winged helix-turn-helix transcriptional regulator [Ruegeria sp.]|uniref:MarR family winged helix-turn-helix transcriptional regulator n=1 Tax=Ruegeria sp. TaxID=1879320 RepID=UPI003C7A4EA9